MTTDFKGPTLEELGFSPEQANPVSGVGPWTTVITNAGAGANHEKIALQQAGAVWIAYEYVDAPAASINLWHQGGSTEPIRPGYFEYQVGTGDCIVWTLSSPANEIKVGWRYAT